MKKLPLRGKNGKGKFTMLDDEDAARLEEMGVSLYADKISKNGTYVRFSYEGKKFYLHRFLMQPSKEKVVDHINHNPLDNRKANLRICTHLENIRNSKSRRNSSSKYKGVRWVDSRQKYRVEICYNKKRVNLGYFQKETDAALAYNAKAKELFGEFAFLNDVGVAE